MVQLLPAAAFSLCAGFKVSLPLPKEHLPTPSQWDVCEQVSDVVKVLVMFDNFSSYERIKTVTGICFSFFCR
jgi:ataxia telangiectasia mutated family protein